MKTFLSFFVWATVGWSVGADSPVTWVRARPDPLYVEPNVELLGQAEVLVRKGPTAIFEDRIIELPPYGEPIILPFRDSYIVEPVAPLAAVPFTNWEAIEYVDSIGHVYRRFDDDLEFVLGDYASHPVIRRPIALSDAVQLRKSVIAPSLIDTFDEMLPVGLSYQVKALCDGREDDAFHSINPLCVGRDLWRALVTTQENRGSLRPLALNLWDKEGGNWNDGGNWSGLNETAAVAVTSAGSLVRNLLGTIYELVRSPLQVLGIRPLEASTSIGQRARAFGHGGNVIGIVASVVETSGLFGLFDRVLGEAPTVADQLTIPLPYLRSWINQTEAAIEETERRLGQWNYWKGLNGTFLKPLWYIRGQLNDIALQQPAAVMINEALATAAAAPISLTGPAVDLSANASIANVVSVNASVDAGIVANIEYPGSVVAHLRQLRVADDTNWLIRLVAEEQRNVTEFKGMIAERVMEDIWREVSNADFLKIGTVKALSTALSTTLQTLRELPARIISYSEETRGAYEARAIPRRMPGYLHGSPRIFLQSITGNMISLLPQQIAPLANVTRDTAAAATPLAFGRDTSIIGQLLGFPLQILNGASASNMPTVTGLLGTVVGGANDILGVLGNLF